MKARSVALLLTAALVVYFFLVGLRGVALIQSGDAVAVVLGIAVLVVPILAAVLVGREIRFGQSTARLGHVLAQRNELPIDDLPKRPSGRVVRADADARANALIEKVKAQPQNWMLWFHLSVAYDWAGDRARARQAMRTAIELERQSSSSK